MHTSFRKNAKGTLSAQRIPGTQRSLHNGQLLCSTGVPSLDSIIGGGMPVGSVLLVEEDSNDQYASLLTRYFVAEGVLSGNGILTVSHESIEAQVNRLPEPIFSSKEPAYLSQERMKIAWRYQALPQVNTSFGQSSDYGHHFDINKPMNLSRLKNCDYHSINLENVYSEETSAKPNMPKNALKKIHHHIIDNNFSNENKSGDQKSKLLRILLPNFGSSLWGILHEQDIIQFLLCLRTVMRNSLAVCVISVPAHIHSDSIGQSMRLYSDAVIQLEDFGSDKTNPLYKEYHGLLKIHKLPILNTLLPFMPDTLDLAFKLKRKKFSIERLHLPPDLAEATQHKIDHPDSMTCSSVHTSPIDF